jgi:hypothetical protein
MKKTTWIGLLAVAGVAGGLLLWRAEHAASQALQAAQTAPPAAGGVSPWLHAEDASAAPAASAMPGGGQAVSPEEQQKLQAAYDKLSPTEKQTVARTTAYVGFMERMRGILESTQPVHLSPQEAEALSTQADGFERDNYFSVSQAFELKAALMRDAYQGAELEQRIASLQQTAAQQFEALKAQSDPSKDPTFRAFKAEQDAMIAQANQMGNFPQGMSRDQYIIQESERIRARYYKD